MDFTELFKSVPGMEGAAAQHGKALQAQMMLFLSKKIAGKTRFIEIESASIQGLKKYLTENNSRVIHWNIVTDPQTGKFILLTEEVTE